MVRRKRRRLFTTTKLINLNNSRRHPFYLKKEEKPHDRTGGFGKVSGGRVGGKAPGGYDNTFQKRGGDEPLWALEPIREKGAESAKKRLPKISIPKRRKRTRSPNITTSGSNANQGGDLNKEKSVKYMPKNKPQMTSKAKQDAKKFSEAQVSKINKYHNEGVKKGLDGYAGSAKPPITSSSSNPVEPFSVQTAKKKAMLSNNAYENRTEHTVRFNTGTRPTNAVFRLAKDNGTRYGVLQDTKQDYLNSARRQLLDHSCGFNSKCFIIPPRDSFISVTDVYKDIFNLSDTPTAQNDHYEGSRYGALMSTVSQMRIHNQSAYLPCKVIAHLCKLKTTNETENKELSSFFEEHVFNNVLNIQNDGAMPVWYQHGTPVAEQDTGFPDTKTVHCDVSYKGKGLYASPRFRATVDVVRSHSTRLDSGDFLNIRHIHEYGPGVDFSLLTEMWERKLQDNAPFAYFIILELQGYPCEGLYKETDGTLTTYLGKSPAFIKMEFKKSFLGALAENTTSNENYAEADTPLAIRDFVSDHDEDDASLTSKEFFVLPDKVVATIPTVAETLSVTVVSDKTRVTHTTATSNLGTEANP